MRLGEKHLDGGDGMRKGKRAQAVNTAGRRRKRTREKRELEAQLEEKQFELDVANATLDVVLKKYEGDERDPVGGGDKGGDCPLPKRKMQAAKIARETQSLQRARTIAARTRKERQKEGKGGGAASPRSRHFYVQQ